MIERVKLDQRFAGKGDNQLDRLKALRAEGWELTVLIVTSRDKQGRPTELLVLGYLR